MGIANLAGKGAGVIGRLVAMFCAFLAVTPAALTQEVREFRLQVDDELVVSGLMAYLLPRFALKTGRRAKLTNDSPDLKIVKTAQAGKAVLARAGRVFALVPMTANPAAGRFAQWLRSDIGQTAIAAFAPDLVLYLAGVDPLASDRLGRLAMTHAGLAERDHRVLTFCAAGAIPVSVAIGGGYAGPITETVDAYANTFRVARRVFAL